MLAYVLSVCMMVLGVTPLSSPREIAMRRVEVKSAEYLVIEDCTYLALTTTTLPRSVMDSLKEDIRQEVDSIYGETYVCIDQNAVYLISRINRGLDRDAEHYETIKRIFTLRQ